MLDTRVGAPVIEAAVVRHRADEAVTLLSEDVNRVRSRIPHSRCHYAGFPKTCFPNNIKQIMITSGGRKDLP